MTCEGTKLTLPGRRPAEFLRLQLPPPRRSDPAFVYLDRLRPTSRRAMTRALERIAELLQLGVDEIMWWAIPHSHLCAIREALGRRYAAATANQALSGLRGVVAEALEMGKIGPEGYEAVRVIPLFATSPSQSRPVPSTRQIARLIEVAQQAGDPKGVRDAALLGVLATAALKRSEVTELRVADFEPGSGTLRVRDRWIKLGTRERQLIRAWIAHRGRGHGPLFLPMRRSGRIERRQMSGEAVAAVVRERAAQARLGRLAPEDLRRAGVIAELEAPSQR